jgi:RNA polymerase sigma factor for flagellar operon FliA
VFEDLVSDGAEGLLQAARRFDPTLGVKFTTYAHCRIEGAILDGVRRSGWYSRRDYELYREGREPPVWIVRYEAADHALSRVADPAASAEKLADDFRQRRMLADAIRSLPKRERRFVEGYFYDGLLLDDLGAEIGRSKSWTCRLLARALRRLRERLAPAQP